MKIYTKTGDAGQTGLLENVRISKHDLRIHAYGTLDELNSILCVVLTQFDEKIKHDPLVQVEIKRLQELQSALFSLGTILATPPESKTQYAQPPKDAEIQQVEPAIDTMNARLPELKRFILPGGHPCAASTHWARTVARRFERVCTELNQESPLPATVIPYVNRLSDYLFVLARFMNNAANIPDVEWRSS
jgi:cob(I)alamin adenosyltransferase